MANVFDNEDALYVSVFKNGELKTSGSGGSGGSGVQNPMTSNLDGGGYNISNVGTSSHNITETNSIQSVGTQVNINDDVVLLGGKSLTSDEVIVDTLTALNPPAISSTTNIDFGGGHGITNADEVQSALLTCPNINECAAPIYNNVGSVVPPVDYEIARITLPAQAEASAIFVIRCLDVGLKQQIVLQVIGFGTRGVIRILNHQSESDTLIFTSIKYGTDGAINYLVATCGTPSATCEMRMYQNQDDKGAITYGNSWEFGNHTPVTLTTTYNSIPVQVGTAGTSGNFNIEGALEANSHATDTLQVNQISVWTDPAITLNSDVNGVLTNLSNFNTIQAVQGNFTQLTAPTDIAVLTNVDLQNNQIYNSLGDNIEIGDNLKLNGNDIIEIDAIEGNAGNDITSNSNLAMGGNDLKNVNNIRVDNIFENTASNDVVVHNTLNMNNNHI